MDRVHELYLYGGLHLYCAPRLLLRRHVVALPAQNVWAEEVQGAYKRRRGTPVQRVRFLVRHLFGRVRVLAIVDTSCSTSSSCTVNLLKQRNTLQAGRRGFTSLEGPEPG